MNFEKINEHIKSLENAGKSLVVGKSKEIFKRGGFSGFADHWLKIAGVSPCYLQTDSPDFRAIRGHLNTDPGLIIGNHPGPSNIDTLLILKALTRRDLKLAVAPMAYKKLSQVFDPENLAVIQPQSAGLEQWQAFSGMDRYIVDGGAVLYFPTGGREMKEKEFIFQKGFRILLSRLRPDDMVYSFYADTDDMKTIKEHQPWMTLGMGVEELLSPKTNPNRKRAALEVKVNEKYTIAQRWQEVLKYLTEPQKDLALTNFYKTQFIK